MSGNYFAVCEKCFVKCVRHHKDCGSMGMMTWNECPICHNGDPALNKNVDDPILSMFNCNLTEEDLESNLRLLAHFKGLDPDILSGEIWD